MQVITPYATPREAARYCRCRQEFIEALIARGLLPLCVDITEKGKRLVDLRVLDRIMSPDLGEMGPLPAFGVPGGVA